MIKLKSLQEDIKQASLDARLNLAPEEVLLLEEKIDNIFRQAEFLQVNALNGVEPTFFPHTRQNTLREDIVSTSMPLDTVLKNAPEADGIYFLVPKIVE